MKISKTNSSSKKNTEDKKSLEKDVIESRLRRIEGQIRGIQKMYKKDKCDSVGITTQIQAARAALSKVAMLLLLDEAKRCADKGDLEELESIVDKTFKSL